MDINLKHGLFKKTLSFKYFTYPYGIWAENKNISSNLDEPKLRLLEIVKNQIMILCQFTLLMTNLMMTWFDFIFVQVPEDETVDDSEFYP